MGFLFVLAYELLSGSVNLPSAQSSIRNLIFTCKIKVILAK